MIVNAQSIELAFKGFKTVFTDAYMSAPAHADTFLEKSGPVFAPLFKASHLTGAPPAAHVRHDSPL
jgi:hypothetical protein